MRWPQDAQSHLLAWAVGNGEILDIDRQQGNLARLRLPKGNPPLLRTKGEKQGWRGRSLDKRLRLGF